MKFFSTVVIGSLFIAAPIARAQEVAPTVTAPTPNMAQDAAKNGYETLIAAGKLILPGENGRPSASERNLLPQENLRRQRVAVARNAPALKLLREALQMPIEAPMIENEEEAITAIAPFARFREMARQLRQESDVRAADGDFVGALDSRLTSLELGAAVSRGVAFSMLVGVAIEAVARSNFETLAAKLDAAQIRALLPRMKALTARRPKYSQNLQFEKASNIRFALFNSKGFLETDQATRLHNIDEFRKEFELSDAQMREFIAMTPQTLTEQLSKVLDGFIAREELPFQSAQKAKLPPAPSGFVRNLTFPLDGIFASARFNYERNRAADLLLQSALELRAIKLETGAYPTTFDAPLDPFGDKEPLTYERNGATYLLYSIGPDGIDNGGKPFPTTRQQFNPDTGQLQTVVSRAVRADSRGDILAPKF